jgi:hypothetical protein
MKSNESESDDWRKLSAKMKASAKRRQMRRKHSAGFAQRKRHAAAALKGVNGGIS